LDRLSYYLLCGYHRRRRWRCCVSEAEALLVMDHGIGDHCWVFFNFALFNLLHERHIALLGISSVSSISDPSQLTVQEFSAFPRRKGNTVSADTGRDFACNPTNGSGPVDRMAGPQLLPRLTGAGNPALPHWLSNIHDISRGHSNIGIRHMHNAWSDESDEISASRRSTPIRCSREYLVKGRASDTNTMIMLFLD
jgi:hypothetical protein